MPLYAGEMNLRRGAPLAEYPAPLSEVLRTQAEQTQLENPMSSLGRLRDLERAETGDMLDIGDVEAGVAPTYASVRRVDATTARQRVKDEGLSLTIPDDGISEKALDILMRRKRAEMRRQDVFSRSDAGLAGGAARLGVALYESLFDPLNIATAFIPVVGPSRYAAMVAGAAGGLGRAGVRAGVGAVEGAVGAALVEPLIYMAAQAEQADYTMADSLANIAFGSIFGGGLHAGAGAVRDIAAPGWWRTVDAGRAADEAAQITARVDFETREAALRASVAQAAEGRLTQVDPIIRSDPNAFTVYHGSPHSFDRFDMSRTGTGEGSQAFGHGLYLAENQAVAREYADAISGTTGPANVAYRVMAAGGDVEHRLRTVFPDIKDEEIAQAIARAKEIKGNLYRIEVQRDAVDRMLDWDKKMADQPPGVRQALEQIEDPMFRAWQANGSWEHVHGQTLYRHLAGGLTNGAAAEGKHVTASALLKQHGIPGIRYLDDGSRKAGDGTRNMVLFDDSLARIVELNGEPMNPAQVRAAAERNAQPDAIRSSDQEASRTATAVDAQAKATDDLATAEQELADTLADAQAFAKALGSEERVKADLKDFDEAIVRAEAYGKALRAAAACGVA